MVPEHEDKTDCPGNHNCPDSYHSIICMRWLQLLMILHSLLVLLLLVNCFLMRLLVILSVITRQCLYSLYFLNCSDYKFLDVWKFVFPFILSIQNFLMTELIENIAFKVHYDNSSLSAEDN